MVTGKGLIFRDATVDIANNIFGWSEMMRSIVYVRALVVIFSLGLTCKTDAFEKVQSQPEMDGMWGDRVVKLRAEDARRGQLFDQGNYAMLFIGVFTPSLGIRLATKPFTVLVNG